MLASFTNKIKIFFMKPCVNIRSFLCTSDNTSNENIFVVILTLNETTIRGTISLRHLLTW